MAKTIRVLLVGIGIVVLVAMWCIIKTQEAKVVYIQKLDIPSAREVQRRLKELDNPRYDPGEIDGIIGSKSKVAWDNYICDRYAKETFDNLQ